MPQSNGKIQQHELRVKALAYVNNNMRSAGGLLQAWHGFWLKTFPFVFGLEARPSFLRILVLLIRVALLVAAALTPVLIRRVAELRTVHGDAETVLGSAVHRMDRIDLTLASIVVLVNFGVKFLETFAKQKSVTGKAHPPFHDLGAAIDKMPALANGVERERRSVPPLDDAIRLAMQGLKAELTHLIGDDRDKQVVDVTLLEYSDPSGTQMHVRVRTSPHEPTRRPMEAWRLMADYVAKEGRWFVEHDFLGKRNPFPPIRLSLQGKHRVEYRSVLFLPIYSSEVVPVGAESDGLKQSVDRCIGVICAHSPRPYRFWRWGDHRREMGGFGNVAYQRSLPYLSLIRRLLEPSAPKVALEVT